MGTQTGTHTIYPHSLPGIRRVASDRPWFWLAEGWGDFVHAPLASLSVGLLVTAAMLLVVSLVQPDSYPFLAAGVFAGTVFLGPVMAVGLYELSRRIEHRRQVALAQIHFGWMRNAVGVLAAGGVLLLAMLIWYLASTIAGVLLFGMESGLATGMASVGMLFVYAIIGVIVMAVIFILMVVSVPMLIDRPEVDIILAMQGSIKAVRKNPGVMMLWAMLIVLFTALAVAPLFLGLSVVFPLLAYASWHAYRDLVAR